MDLSSVAHIATTAAQVVVSLAAIYGVRAYRASVKAKRSEWLASLHEKFFETDRYARIRRVLDYPEGPEYSGLAHAIAEGQHHAMADELYRYLNFFEFLASLRHLGEISNREIRVLFEHDLRLMSKHRFIQDILSRGGFERLPGLFKLVRTPGSR